MNKFDNEPKEPEMGYFKLINSILDVVVELNTDLITTYINRQVHDLFGYSPEELIGKKYFDLIHPNDISKIKKAIRKTTKTGEVISEEFRIQHKKGCYIPVSARCCKVEYNNQIRIIAIFRDIKNEKQAQQRLKESDKRNREIIENIEDGYFEVDLQGNYIYVNDYICRYLGFSKKELIGKSYTSMLNKKTYKEVYEIFNLVYKNNLPKGTFESKVIRNDGQERTFEGTFYLRYDTSGKKVGFYGFTRDISEKKKVEEKIKESVQKLKKSEEKYREAYNRAELYKDLFYHDINNILSNIKLSISISEKYLDEPGKEREIKDLYELIKGQFERGTKLITNVRKLSNLENLEKSLKSVKAIKILEEAIKFVQNSRSLKDINIRIITSEKKIITRANEFLIDIFDNLLINAVNYNENPKKEVLIKISRQTKVNIGYVKFEFIDNGIGISDKRKELIFQEGFSKEKGSKGMGFGLTLVKKIIESYKGEIWIEDRVKGDYSHGSNFVFLIPEAIE